MNKTKTKILTLPEGLYTQATLLPEQFSHLNDTLTLLDGNNSEIKGGFRLLGQPIGTDTFEAAFLQKVAHTFATAISCLSKHIKDPQSMAMLFKFCALLSLSHLLAADILLQTTSTGNTSIAPWTSPFIEAIQATTESFLLSLSRTSDPLPLLASHLAHACL
jgi:hypothetical protein